MRTGVILLKKGVGSVWRYGKRWGSAISWMKRWAFMLPLTKTRGDLLPYAIAPHTITPTVRCTCLSIANCKLPRSPLRLLSLTRLSCIAKHNQDSSLKTMLFRKLSFSAPEQPVTAVCNRERKHIMRTIQEKSKGPYSPGNRSYCD